MIAENRQHVAVKAFQHRRRGHHGIAGAELLLLDDAPVRRHLFSYQFAVGRGHDHNLVGVHAVERIKDIAYHRLTADRHQHLRQIRLHPGAFAGTEHNGSNFRASHIFPFLIFF